MPAPLFSIVIPTRARPEALSLCLAALKDQVLSEGAEVIVTDDGASDETPRLINLQFPFARWTQGPRRGPAGNRNHGASLATGEFVIFVDDDVVPSAGFLAAYRLAIQPDVDVYEGRTSCAEGVRSPLQVAPVNETGGYLWSCNMMVRRTFWNTFGGFDEDFKYPHMEDVAFRERLKAAGKRFPFVSGALVDHPARRMVPARARLRVHEAHLLYSYKYVGRPPHVLSYLRYVANYSFRNVARCQVGVDSVVALSSIMLELSMICLHWRTWNESYRAYRGTSSARPFPPIAE